MPTDSEKLPAKKPGESIDAWFARLKKIYPYKSGDPVHGLKPRRSKTMYGNEKMAESCSRRRGGW